MGVWRPDRTITVVELPPQLHHNDNGAPPGAAPSAWTRSERVPVTRADVLIDLDAPVHPAEAGRGRGRPRKHPSWIDPETGESKALRDHPNYSVCKNFQRNALAPVDPEHPFASRHGEAEHFQLVHRWKDDVAAFTYELTARVGIRPGRFHLIWPTDPRRPVGPDNVEWLTRPRDIREARRQQIASLEAQEIIAELLAESDHRPQPDGSHLQGAVVNGLRHLPSCETQRQALDPVDCPCTEHVRERSARF